MASSTTDFGSLNTTKNTPAVFTKFSQKCLFGSTEGPFISSAFHDAFGLEISTLKEAIQTCPWSQPQLNVDFVIFPSDVGLSQRRDQPILNPLYNG